MIDPIEIAKRHFPQTKAVSTKGITFGDEVRRLCEQNSCGHYGRNWTCPPALPSIDHYRQILTGFGALLIMPEVYSIKDSYDWKGMLDSMAQFKEKLQHLNKEITAADAGFNFLTLGAGACQLCETCTYPTGKPCRHPKEAIVSLEACGIDVMRLLRDHALKYYNGKGTVTYVGGLAYDDP